MVRCLAAIGAFVAMTACTSGSQIVNHSFEFHANLDSPDVEVLDYRYGESKFPSASNPEDLRREGRSLQSAGISGPMRRGESLYVKWRIKSTGKVYEDTVDLRRRLPEDITDHTIYFIIKGPQLYVYLVPPFSEKRPAGAPPTGPAMYRYLNTIRIYPDETKP